MGSCGFIARPSPAASRHPLPAHAGRGATTPRVPLLPARGEKVPEGRMRGASLEGSPSYVEENLLDVNDVLEIEEPPQDHFDRQQHHDQEEERADVVTRRAHLQIEAAERSGREQRRKTHVPENERNAEDLADRPELR